MALEPKANEGPGPEQAAPPARPITDFSLGRKVGVGLNVTLAVVAAAALLVLVNFISAMQFVHVDQFGRSALSDNLRAALANADQPVTLTVLYSTEDKGKEREKYQPRIMELIEEMQFAAERADKPPVRVEDIATAAQRGQFAERIQERRGGSAKAYQAAVDGFGKLAATIREQVKAEREVLVALSEQQPTPWVMGFAQTATAFGSLGSLETALKKVDDKLSALGGDRLPEYNKQIDLIKPFVQDSLKDLRARQKEMADLDVLAAKMTEDAGGGVIIGTTTNLKAVQAAMADLAPGGEGATTRPADEDPAAVVRRIGAARRAIAEALGKEAKLLKAFAADQPAVTQHQLWYAGTVLTTEMTLQTRGLDQALEDLVSDLTSRAAEAETRAKESRPEALREYLPGLLAEAAREQQVLARSVIARVAELVRSLAAVDAASQKLVGQKDEYLAAMVKPLADLDAQIGKLPKLQFGELAEKLKDDNLVLVQVGDGEPRVLSFDEVWTPMAPLPGATPEPNESMPRSFNGDPAIAAALITLTGKPYAEVVFVYSQGQPNRMTGQADEGEIPFSQLSVLRDRLAKANLKVSEWNLAESPEPPPPAFADEKADDAKAKEDSDKDESAAASQPAEKSEPLPRVYVVLPPPAPMPDPYGGGQQGGLTPEQEDAVTEALADGGRALFLAGYSFPRRVSPWMPPMSMPYGWDRYLSGQWGLTVQSDYRLIEGIPAREPGSFGLSGARFNYMRLNHFTDQPIGKPLQARRILLTEACPIKETDHRPGGVSYEPVLTVPADNRSIWATSNVMGLIEQLQQSSGGTVHPDFTSENNLRPPFKVLVTAVRQPSGEGETKESRLVLFAAGQSLADYYLGQKVVRGNEETGVVFEPPPDADAEIAINSIYWLIGRADRIAAGPIPTPAIAQMSLARLLTIRMAVVWGGPLAILMFGAVVWLFRRRV